jgi:hypothetical protein
LRQSIVAHSDEIDWDRVAGLARTPRAIPVPVTGAVQTGAVQTGAVSTGADAQTAIDAVLAKSLLVENVLPEGSNWDGKTGLLVDEKTYNGLVGARDKPATQAAVR